MCFTTALAAKMFNPNHEDLLTLDRADDIIVGDKNYTPSKYSRMGYEIVSDRMTAYSSMLINDNLLPKSLIPTLDKMKIPYTKPT